MFARPEVALSLSRLGRASTYGALAVAVGLIAVATLVPVSPAVGWQRRTFGTCLFCGELGGLDAVNNVLLYLPFGAAATAAGWGWRRTTGTAMGLATAVELIQFAGLAGRYPGLGDILFNTIGATAGSVLFATRRRWLAPSPAAARPGALAAAAGFIAVAAATCWLLGLSVPEAPLIAQWAPHRGVPFTGALHGTALNAHALSAGPLDTDAADRFRSLGRTGRAALEAEITPPRDPPRGFAPIVRIVTDERVHLALGQSGETILFIPALRSREIGFRTLAIGVPIAPDAPDRLVASGTTDPHGLQVAVQTASRQSTSSHLDLTVGLGWATMLPVSVPIGGWHRLGSAAWLLLLAIPVGFYGTVGASARWEWLLIPITILCGLSVVPAAAGIALSGWSEWAGAVTGAALGAVAGLRRRRARFVHRGVSSTWTAELRDKTG